MFEIVFLPDRNAWEQVFKKFVTPSANLFNTESVQNITPVWAEAGREE